MAINTIIGLGIAAIALVGVACGVISILDDFGVFDKPEEHKTYDYTLDEPEGRRNA